MMLPQHALTMKPSAPSWLLPLWLAATLIAPQPTLSQSFEGVPPPAGEKVEGYLADSHDAFRLTLPAPPEDGSAIDQLDVDAIKTLQRKTSKARWALAVADQRSLYPQFVEAFGGPIDRAHTPALVGLLNRVEMDSDAPIFAAKDVFRRPRPYQRLRLSRMCGIAKPPAPDPNPTERSSYPSGHSARGWAAALLLAQVAPERAPLLLQRASDYGLSREICGMHFPSDVEAGRVSAVQVLTALQSVPAFQHDLACVHAEHSGALPSTPHDCSVSGMSMPAPAP